MIQALAIAGIAAWTAALYRHVWRVETRNPRRSAVAPDPFGGEPKLPEALKPTEYTEARHCTACGVQWSARRYVTADWRCFVCDAVGRPGSIPVRYTPQ